MDMFEKIDDLIWRCSIYYEEDCPYEIAVNLEEKYPNATVEIEKMRGVNESRKRPHDIFYWIVDITFKNEADEAEFIMRETSW